VVQYRDAVKNSWRDLRFVAVVCLILLPKRPSAVPEIVGIENALKLSQHLSGLYFYYPQLDSLLRKKRDEHAQKEFNGSNHRELSRKYNLTESWIRIIVQRKPAYEQTDIFSSSDLYLT